MGDPSYKPPDTGMGGGVVTVSLTLTGLSVGLVSVVAVVDRVLSRL